PEHVLAAPLVFNRYDFSLGINEFKHGNTHYKLNLDKVMFTVDIVNPKDIWRKRYLYKCYNLK
ncbi:hypothetical protein NAI35_11150, partial [Francisella tularensis subsp. holarctica]|nr:hypothetical protein [Francisella tularensis subsp. holarctica]